MTQSRLSALGLILAAFLCFQTAHAQQTTSPENDQAAAKTALRDKAFALLESLSDQLSILQSAENRARIGSNIADSIWHHDEKRARALFANVEEDISLGLQFHENSAATARRLSVFIKLREDNAERLAKHDPEAALEFLKRTEPLPSLRRSPELTRKEHALELRLAKRVAAQNPTMAVKFADRSLAAGLSTDILPLLLQLSRQDKQQANTLYKAIVDRIRDSDPTKNWQSEEVMLDLLRSFGPPVGDDSTHRELVNIILQTASTHGCFKPKPEEIDERAAFCFQVGSLLPIVAKVSPVQARGLAQWTSPSDDAPENLSTLQGNLELNSAYGRDAPVDDILALLNQYPQLEGQIRTRAIWRAETNGDFERAEKIARAYRGDDPDLRREFDERIQFYNLSAEIIEEKLILLQRDIAKEPVREQIRDLFTAADYVSSRHPKIALRMLGQIAGSIESLDAGEEQLRFNIRLALSYCRAKDDRGFAIMESLLPKLNELVDAAAKLDGFDTQYLRDGEWNMSADGPTGSILTFLANNAGDFARIDFDRAVALTAQFERPEIRIMGQLKLAQGVLNER
jgi:hypothetical protein